MSYRRKNIENAALPILKKQQNVIEGINKHLTAAWVPIGIYRNKNAKYTMRKPNSFSTHTLIKLSSSRLSFKQNFEYSKI